MEPFRILDGKDSLVEFLKTKGFKEEKDYSDPEYDKGSYFKIGRRRLLAVYEVLDIKRIRDIRNHFLIEKGLSYCAILHDGKVLFFRNFGEGRYFLYSERTKYNRAKIDKLRRIDEKFDILFQRKDISGAFYEKFKLKRNFLVRHIKNDVEPVEKYLLAQKIFDRIFFIYFLCHKGIVNFKEGGAISGENLFKIMIENGDFIGNLKNLFRRFNIKENDFLDVGNYKIRIPYLNGDLFRPDPLEQDLKLDLREKDWKGIFHFLNQYHWIIEEDVETAIEDEEKVLTPEILGHVYERSVVEWEKVGIEKEAEDATKEISERKKKGVYYTPEEVTGYIAENTIYPFLLSQFNGEFKDIDDLIENSDKEELRRLLNHLSKIKVLDPACGSGAFLIKASEMLFHLKVRVLNRLDKKPKYYDVKLDTITENIYGVDILEGAIELAKLRLWLWLVSDYIEASEIQPLPNIEYNLRVGNSLIGWVDEKLKQTSIKTPLTDGVRSRFLGLISYTDNKKSKEIVKAMELLGTFNLKNYILAYTLLYKIYRKMHGLEAKFLKEIIEVVRQAIYQSINSVFLIYINEKIDPNYKKKKPPKPPISQSQFRSLLPFHWRVDFGQIIDVGGFDIIIGNPPYGNILTEIEKEALTSFETIDNNEICANFIERQMQLLKRNNFLGNILAGSIVINKNTTSARDLLREYITKSKIMYFGTRPARIFTDAEIRVSILIGKKDMPKSTGVILTSEAIKFTKDQRDNLNKLLNNVSFESTAGLLLGERIGLRNDMEDTQLPKIGYKIVRDILRKLKAISTKRVIQNIIINQRQRESLEFRKTGGYWLNALPEMPYRSTKIEKIGFANKLERDFCLLIINSSLFYLYWSVYGNLRDLPKSLIEKFPVPIRRKLNNQSKKILQLQKNVSRELLRCFRAGRGRVGEFNTAACKDIIDEIDDLLGELYGLTNEEVEFIKNYDKHIRPNKSRRLKQ